jgi:TRAP-type C4-dicarboxylate transport system permease small subunit
VTSGERRALYTKSATKYSFDSETVDISFTAAYQALLAAGWLQLFRCFEVVWDLGFF